MTNTWTSPSQTCPIWGTPATIQAQKGDYKEVNSDRAGGRYRITDTAEAMLSKDTKESGLNAKITTWLLNQRQEGVTTPKITSSTIEIAKKNAFIPFSKKIENFFKFIDQQSPNLTYRLRIGDAPHVKVNTNKINAAIESCETQSNELGAFAELIAKLEYIEINDMRDTISIKPKGWEYLENLSKKRKNGDNAFVAMWFDKSLNEVFKKQFEKALTNCGYVPPFRIDQHDHSGKIDDEIIACINKASLVIVDLTCAIHPRPEFLKGTGNIIEARGGVYFEAGYAKGLDIPVIWTCRKDSAEHVHFDTRQYNQIIWHQEKNSYVVEGLNGTKSLEEALINRISAMGLNRNVTSN